tara:strand:+ start:600 stop:806 length:207 start_codon:yes stop_codon:yes gene_type:complete
MLNKKGVINMKQSSKDFLDEVWIRTEFTNIVKTSSQKHLIQMCLLVVAKMTNNSFRKFVKLHLEQESA